MATPVITSNKIRQFLMDRPELNTLMDGVRWSDEVIDDAVITVIDAYNSMPPPIGGIHTVETFPFRYLLLTGVAGWLLKGAAIGEASNNLTYQADGVSVGDRDKAQVFMEIGGALWKEFKDQAQQLKISQNVNALLGAIPSEYGWGRITA